jgi:hypothetical protein
MQLLGQRKMKAKTTMLALFDVLGFENRLHTMGLDSLKASYDLLIAYVRSMDGCLCTRSVPNGDGTFSPAVGYLKVEQAYFSDTLLVWSNYDVFRFPAFCQMCCGLMCESLRIGLPLRGVLSVGDAILDISSGVYIGLPIIEAARLESQQRWLGVSFGDSFTHEPYNQGYDLRTVMDYSTHWKDEEKRKEGSPVLDWPRHWRQEKFGDAVAVVSALDKDPRFHPYYAATLDFIAHSERQHDWFKRPEYQRKTPSRQSQHP